MNIFPSWQKTTRSMHVVFGKRATLRSWSFFSRWQETFVGMKAAWTSVGFLDTRFATSILRSSGTVPAGREGVNPLRFANDLPDLGAAHDGLEAVDASSAEDDAVVAGSEELRPAQAGLVVALALLGPHVEVDLSGLRAGDGAVDQTLPA